MSLSNPDSVVTEQRLSEFYNEIYPYLGGSAAAGFTPVGTIIAVMGVTAPANYLACSGQVLNIADYPELANYFLQQFGSKNKFGGDGTTTFGIPDLRGEFLRMTGANSHTNQGNGAPVGQHQDATEHIRIGSIGTNTSSNSAAIRVYANNSNSYGQNFDSSKTGTHYKNINQASVTTATEASFYTSRPTNTSVLYCIATKNITMGGGGYTELTDTLTAGQTSITFTNSAITSTSTIDVYTDGDVEYDSISTSTGSLTITFDAQASDLGVKVRVS